MEKDGVLQEYVNRQVVINVYREDELLARDGYRFDCIEQDRDRICFVRENRTVVELKLNETAHLIRLSGFPRYYAIEQDGLRTELYFP